MGTKKILLLVLLMQFINSLFAQNKSLTVSNDPNRSAQYSTLLSAIIAANNGDTIYVFPTAFNYGDITINKRLVLIGSGHNRNTQFTIISQLNTVIFDTLTETTGANVKGVSGATGSQIHGFKITNQLTVNNSKNILIKNNYIIVHHVLSLTDGCRLLDNIIIPGVCDYGNCGPERQVNVNLSNNVLISNNILTNGILVGGSNKNSVIFQNNLVLGCTSFINTYDIYGWNRVSNMILQNNIFAYSYPNDCIGCVFNNNLIYANANDTIPYANNTGTNNILSKDPLFINLPANIFTFDYTYDYRLQALSPANNAGTDKDEIGIYGGLYKMKSENGVITGKPFNPQIYKMNIFNTVVPQNGTLNFEVKVKTNN